MVLVKPPLALNGLAFYHIHAGVSQKAERGLRGKRSLTVRGRMSGSVRSNFLPF